MIEEQFQINKAHLYKTELCIQYKEDKFCKYGKKCQYAHGAEELREVKRNHNYKSQLCENYIRGNICPYGKRCFFLHEEPKKRLNCFEKRCPSNSTSTESADQIISDKFKNLII